MAAGLKVRAHVIGASSASLLTLIVATAALPASAQTPVASPQDQSPVAQADGDASSAPEDRSGGLEEIVVTAQRRGENLQRVPIAVSAVSANSLASAGITNAADLGRVVPTLSVFTTTGAVQPFLRGVGTPSSLQGYESSVAIYLDDTYIPRVPPSLLELSSIERVEVLKGPQGTLFGRNASGGLLHIVTRDPSPDPVLQASVGYGSFQTFRATLYASTSVTPNLSIDVAGLINDQAQGWGRNVTTNGEWGKDHTRAIRSKLKWTPFNAAGFYYQLKDAQFQQFNGPTVLVINAESARIWGADFDGEAAITRDLRIRFGGGYLDTKYTSFANAQTPVNNPNTDPALGPVGGYRDGYAPFDATGNRLVRPHRSDDGTGGHALEGEGHPLRLQRLQ